MYFRVSRTQFHLFCIPPETFYYGPKMYFRVSRTQFHLFLGGRGGRGGRWFGSSWLSDYRPRWERYETVSANSTRNSSVGSVLGSLSCLMQRCGFDPPLERIFQVEGIFPLELT